MGLRPTFFITNMFGEKLIRDKINEVVRKNLPQDIELVDLAFKGKGKVTIKILIDKTTGGIDLEECAQFSRKLGEELDKADIIEKSYMLDVSSPGIDYPLKTVNDFKRNIDKMLEINTLEEVNDKNQLAGRLKRVQNDSVIIETRKGNIIKIDIDNIKKAKQIII